METVYNEIPTDVDNCYQCGLPISHDCVRATGSKYYDDFHIKCWEKYQPTNFVTIDEIVKVTKFVLKE